MKKILACLIALSCCIAVSAQTRQISGVVTDSSNQPVPGAVVMADGTTDMAAVTDNDGKYTISTSASVTALTVSCLGFKTQVRNIGKTSRMDFILEYSSEEIDETIVVGYGSMKRSDLTGSVSSVRVDEDNAARSTTMDQLIRGRVSGVQVMSNSGAPDGGINIRVRGLSSFNGSTEPLYVVDGVIINAASGSEASLTNAGAEGGTSEETNGMNGINPQDIASIEILKDASATAIFGSQGANGVVLITTKSAKKEKPVVNFNSSVTVSTAYRHLDMLKFDEYVSFLKDNGNTAALERIYDPQTGDLIVTPVDWQDYSMRTAVSQKYYLSISGKPKTAQYYFSLGYNDTQGVLKNTGFRQLTSRLSVDSQLFKALKVGAKVNVSYSSSLLSQGATSTRVTAQTSMLRSIVSFRPFSGYEMDESDYDDEDNAASPDKWLKYFDNTKREFRVTPSIYVQWQILPWLTFKSSFGCDYRGAQLDKYKGQQISRLVGSIASRSSYENIAANWDNLFLVDKQFKGGHSLSGTLGITMTSNSKDITYTEGWFLPGNNENGDAINTATPPNSTFWYKETNYSILSFLARAIYNYKERYILTGTMRADGSSRFQGRNKWGYFPSVAFAWRLAQEPWFNVSWISSAKLRASWGLVGNQAVSSYATIPTYSGVIVSDHTPTNPAMGQIGIYLDAIANRDLRWETTSQFNVGFDLGFFQGRLSLSADYYDKTTRDLLQTKQIARSSGFATMWVNQGSIRNRGFEFSIDAVPVKTRNFEWTVGGNISVNRNRITEIGEDIQSGTIYIAPGDPRDVNYFWGSSLRVSTSNISVLNIFIEDQPMALFYGLKSAGIVQTGEDWPGFGTGGKAKPGDVKYLDLNGNGVIDDDDRTIIGDPNPDFTFGFSTSFTYKRLSLVADFDGSYGNDIYNNNLSMDLNTNYTAAATSVRNIRADAYRDAWSETNTGGTKPRLHYSDDQTYVTDRYVEDGSYLRLANLSLSYRIPLKKKEVLKGMALGVSCGNLLVLTKYSGWDPEVNSFGSDIKRMGVDVGSYPRARTFTFDLKFTF